MEGITPDRIEHLRGMILGSDVSDICKEALSRLIDASEGLTKQVVIFTRDETIGRPIIDGLKALTKPDDSTKNIDMFLFICKIAARLYHNCEAGLGYRIWLGPGGKYSRVEGEEIPFRQGEDIRLEIQLTGRPDRFYPCRRMKDGIVEGKIPVFGVSALCETIVRFKERYPSGQVYIDGELVTDEVAPEKAVAGNQV